MSSNNQVLIAVSQLCSQVTMLSSKISELDKRTRKLENAKPVRRKPIRKFEFQIEESESSEEESISSEEESISSEEESISSEEYSDLSEEESFVSEEESESSEEYSDLSEEYSDLSEEDSDLSEEDSDSSEEESDSSEEESFVSEESDSSEEYSVLSEEEDDNSSIIRNKIQQIELEIEPHNQSSYTKEEIDMLLFDDYELASEWIKITGKAYLYCSHCKKDKAIADNWIESIRKVCNKDGLCHATRIPKTCDEQQRVNNRSNRINNMIYPILKKPNVSEEDKAKLLEIKKQYFNRAGKKSYSKKYEL